MDKLPNEILHSIFICVPFKQRLECMLACRHWYNALCKRSLLYDLRINGMARYHKFIDFLREMPSRGAQVEILDLEVESLQGFDYKKFYTLLPNLRKINFRSDTWHKSKQDFCYEPITLTNTSSKLEGISDSGYCELTRQVLVYNTCTRLKSLELKLRDIGDLGKNFFAYLKNTPALENLRLGYPRIGIQDCEILHKNVPSIKSLYLDDLFLKSGELPRDIIPATSLKSFSMKINEVKDFHSYPNWYKYVANKYTNVVDYYYEDQNIDHTDTNQAMIIYRDGILPIYKNIGGQHDTFTALNVPIEVGIFNEFSDFDVRFKSFCLINNDDRPIFTQLAESDLSRYAEHIELTNTVISSPVMLQIFTSLRTLKIDMNEAFINLTDYLNIIPPTLTLLSIVCWNTILSELPAHSNNIEELYLWCDPIYPKLGEAITHYFPKINSLSLSGSVLENLTITLPNNHFKEISIDAYFYGPDHCPPQGFSIMTTNSPEPQYYIGKRNVKHHLVNLVPATAEELEDRVTINITIASADKNRFSISLFDVLEW